MQSKANKPERRSSWGKKSGGLFSKESKVTGRRTVEESVLVQQFSSSKRSKVVKTTKRADEEGDQDGLVLESLEVKVNETRM